MPNSEVTCRIRNLTSAKGKLLNGLAASFDPTAPAPQPGRVAVTIDGVVSKLSLKPDNLQMFTPGSYEDLTVTVGRQDLRSQDFNAVVVDNIRCHAVTRLSLNSSSFGGNAALRTQGILMALSEYFNTQRLPPRDILIQLTDLNLALLLNSYACKRDLTVGLGSEQNDLAKAIGKHIISNCHDRTILFKFSPLRIRRGDFPSKEVVDAVNASRFHIYPCPCKTFLDALEVRFLLPNRLSHSFFLDFGQGEAVQYVKNLYHMDNEMARHEPGILADVDPQMFWSSVIHSKAVVKALKKLPKCPEGLVKEWTGICGSYIKTVVKFKELCPSAGEAVRMLPDDKGKWNLINDKIHYNIGYRNAKLALVMGMAVWKPPGARSLPSIEIMDNYKGTDIDLTMAELRRASISGDEQDLDIVTKDIFRWSEAKTCDYCGVQNKKMFDCMRCKSAGYCSKECQTASWPVHKKVCKSLKKESEKEGSTDPDRQKTTLYNPKKVAAKQQSSFMAFSEATGLGYLRIFYCPMNQIMSNMPMNQVMSNIPMNRAMSNMVFFKALKRNTIFKYEIESIGGLDAAPASIPQMMTDMMQKADDVKVFNDDMSNLDPIMRLCLACGPVPNLEVVQSSLDDAIAQAGGTLENIRMRGAGFTPLEWAAKKGHLEIVKWLISDPRSEPMINIGTPVGWACYTGRMKIAKLLVKEGASPEATDETFWDSRPPLLAAAENGRLDAVRFLVEKCGVSILVKWRGNGIMEHVCMSPSWDQEQSFKDILDFARERGAG